MAESSAVTAVRIAGGAVDPGLADVAAPPPMIEPTAPEPQATESQMPAPGEFQEDDGHEPADSEAGPAAEVAPEPAADAEPEMEPEPTAEAEPEMEPETAPEAEAPAPGA
jgi:hypothetical protein